MALYRLDYLAPDGSTAGGVTGFAGMDYLARHASKARARAQEAAHESGCEVQITSIQNGGHLRPTLIVRPDGSARRPANSRPAPGRLECRAGLDARCFCAACRAARKAART
jgi:hypothetical protein